MFAESVRLLGSLGAGILLAFFGLRLYFRQKEYEIVKQRYLEQSLDVISAELELVSSIFSYNWARCLDLLKEYRDSPEPFDTAKLSSGFLDLNGTRFRQSAHHRLQTLTDSQIFWNVYQLTVSRHLTLNSFVINEVRQAICAQIAEKTTITKDEMIEAIMVELEPMQKQSDHFAPLQRAIHDLSRLLEQEHLSFSTVGSFARKPEVIKSAEKLEQIFGAELTAPDAS